MSNLYKKIPKTLKENIALRKSILTRCDADDSFRSDFMAMCAEDVLLWINLTAMIFEPRDAAVLPFITYPYQDPAIIEINKSIGVEDVTLFKGRDLGASWIAMTIALWRWLFKPRQSILCISRKEELVDSVDDPKALMWKSDFIFKHLPEWMKPTIGISDRTRMHFFNPDNGSVIDGESTTESSTVGDRRLWVIGDEIGHYPDGGYPFMQKSRDVTRSRLLIGTPNGTGNALAEIVEQNKMKIVRLHWSDHPLKNKGIYKSPGGKSKPDHVGKLRSPWYDEQCDRALHPSEIASELDMDFMGSGYQFFDEQEIKDFEVRMTRDPLCVGELMENSLSDNRFSFIAAPNGSLALWFDGAPPKGNYVVGCDISQGTGTSSSAAAVIHLESGMKVAELATPDLRPDEFAEYVVPLCRWFGNAFLIWEANGGGGSHFSKRVWQLGYRNFYYKRQEDKVVPTRKDDTPGFFTTGPLKTVLAGQYRKSLLESKYIERSKATLDECRQYVVKGRTIVHMKSQSARNPADEDENHGDRAIATWLAVFAMGEQQEGIAPEKPETYPEGSIAWLLEQRRREQSPEENWPWTNRLPLTMGGVTVIN